MAFSPTGLLEFARKADQLLQLEKKHGAILEAQAAAIQAIKDRLTKLEEHVKAREEILVAEAKGAAASVGSQVASQHMGELSRQVGILQERVRGLQLVAGFEGRCRGSL
jgi:hypothetical protein